MKRDSIDFAKTDISKLFVKLFIPTLLGMLFTSLLNIADGAFLGRGVGSDALAAVNIVAPLYLVTAGVSLMFASGVSVVAAIHLSKGNVKAACINVTQAFTVPLLLMALIVGVLVLFPRETTFLFGGSERLVPMVTDYLVYVSPTMLMCVILYVGMFVLRLDGAPNYAMTANIINSVLNIVLDYVFIFPLGMGIKGAAIATSISTATGALIILAYFFCCSKKIHLYMPKFTLKAIRLTLRNVGYMMKVGLSMLVGETAMACMMIVGNFMFMSRLNEEGVAAFSVACYLTPLVFMVGNAVSQSSLPIVSYNYGLKNYQRIATTFRLIMKVATIAGVLITAMGIWGGEWLVGLFLEQGIPAWQIAVEGFPLFSLGFAFFTLNLVLIGYYQGMKCSRQSTVFMLLRGYLFVVPFFLLLPQLAGNAGLWLAVPLSELLTCITILIYYKMKNDKLTILNYLIGLGDKRR